MIRAFNLNNQISFIHDKLSFLLCVKQSIRITQVWCCSHPEFVPVIQCSSLRAVLETRQVAPRSEPQRIRKSGSGPSTLTREAPEETGGRGKWDKKAELPAWRMTQQHQSCRESSPIFRTSKKKSKAAPRLKSQ